MQIRQQFLAGDAAAILNLLDSAAEFGGFGRIIGDLENLQVPDELLALFRCPVFNFLADFGVTHVARVPQPMAAAIPFFVPVKLASFASRRDSEKLAPG